MTTGRIQSGIKWYIKSKMVLFEGCKNGNLVLIKYSIMSFIFFLLFSSGQNVFAKDLKVGSSQLDVSYYFDNREYNTLNIQTSTDKLPLGIFLWGFIDIHSDQNKNSDRFDLTRYF